MARQTFPIVFGGGIDRATGTASTSPQAMEVAENVVLLRGRLVPRKGNEVRSTLGGAAYVAGIHPDRNTLRSVFVAGFGTPGESSHRLEIWAGTGSGRDAEKIGDWADPCASMEKARVIACQSGPYVILAHDEPSIERRAPTIAVNMEQNTITEITAAWAGGDNKIRFRGVVAWLDYMVGWAFGTNVVDQPHMVRVSDIVAPLTFQEDAWVTFGQAGDPVLACLPSQVGRGGALLARKEVDTFLLTGSDFDTFGTTQVEALHGLAASRLVVTDGATDWFWSAEGPRESRGGVSVDISWPLGLHDWPTAEDIAASGRVDNGFAVYEPHAGVIHFCFHDWLYSYTLDGQRWSHTRLATTVHCGAILYGRTGYEGASRGYPDFASAVSADADSFTITWTDESPEGDETVEVWIRRTGGSWGTEPAATAPISLAPTATVNGVYAGDYEVAIRYKRDGLYASAGDVSGHPTYDYTGSPETWPAVSRGTFTVSGVAPTITAQVWSRQSASVERIAVTYAGGLWPVQLLRNTVNNAGTATLIHTSSAASGTYNDDAPGTGETTVYYFVKNVYPDASTGPVSAAYPRWIGPDAPAGMVQFFTNVIALDADYYKYSVEWDAPPTGTVTKVEDDYLCVATFANQSTTAANATDVTDKTVTKASAQVEDGSEDIVSVTMRARHEITQFAVLDYSEWATLLVDIRIHDDETAYQSCP